MRERNPEIRLVPDQGPYLPISKRVTVEPAKTRTYYREIVFALALYNAGNLLMDLLYRVING